jgi:hypothetical protein
MPTKTIFIDGNAGVMAIANYSAGDGVIRDAVANPYANLAVLNFHSGLSYIQLKDKISYPGTLTYPGVTRELKEWGDKPGGGGCGGSGCCFILLEAKYKERVIDQVIRRYRDEHTTERNLRGYYKVAEKIIPLMQKSKIFKSIIVLTFASPALYYAKWYYKENNWGWIFTPLKLFWMTLFNVLGTNKKFTRKNGENV